MKTKEEVKLSPHTETLIGEIKSGLSDHFKSGQRLSLQNRPTGLAVRD